MIEIKNVSKTFNDFKALSNVSAKIEEGQVFGLVGTNGAGKSTLMRTMCGVYRPSEGEIFIDDLPVYDNPEAKAKIFYISDDQYFFVNGTPLHMMNYYATMYPTFDEDRFKELMDILQLSINRKISTFSKGMKKQVSVALGISSGCKYLLCDETFDGLDPVMRQAVKRLFIQEMDTKGLTPIIASHNLRELEDICNHVGLLHKGGILFDKDMDEMKLGMAKLQVVFSSESDKENFLGEVQVMNRVTSGNLDILTIKGNYEELEAKVKTYHPVFYELLPLSLEEIFISETEVLGYEFKKLAHENA